MRYSLLLSFVLGVGCARPGTQAGARTPAEISTQETSTAIITPQATYSAHDLLVRGRAHLANGRYPQAASDFEMVSKHAASREERLEGLFGWGTALDMGGEPEAALRQYDRFVAEAPPSQRREQAELRVTRLLVYLERYEEAGERALRVSLEQPSALEQIALQAALALDALHRADHDQAEHRLSRGRLIVEESGFDRASVTPLDLAAFYFAEGELKRQRASEIHFNPLPEDFSQALEARCQLILDAQAAYSQSMRSQDAHWSSMAGVRVGELYQDLHRDLMAMPFPRAADDDYKKRLFEGALRLRYSILLRKSVSMMRATVALLQRTERGGTWEQKAKDALREIEENHRQEEAAIDALPYSREQLQQVLDHMVAQAQPNPAGT